MKKKLEQTAVTRPVKEPTLEARSSSVRIGPQLHLSIEHAAIAQMLSKEELDTVLCMARGYTIARLAERYHMGKTAAAERLQTLMRTTRMSRLQLAVLGYQLLGQPDYTDVAAA